MDAERPVVGGFHRACRARLGAELANNAPSVVDEETGVSRFDRMRRTDRRTLFASLLAGAGVVARHAEQTVLAIRSVGGGPRRCRFSARQPKKGP